MAVNLPPRGDPKDLPMGELLKRLADDTATLVKQELALARAEMTQKGKEAGVGVGFLGAGGVVGLMALGALTAFLVLALDTFMPAWLAALLVAVALGAVAAVLGLKGKDKVTDVGSPVPEQTIETVKEDVEWARTRT